MPMRPGSCRLWSCSWLISPEETADLSRPDRSHYVIDPMPDFVTIDHPELGLIKEPVTQIWLDPKHPDAHRDPALRNYIEKTRRAALIRTGEKTAFVIVPPCLSS